MSTTRRVILAGSSLLPLVASLPAQAQTGPSSYSGVRSAALPGAGPEEQLIYQRAIEAIIWSMPAMSDVFFRESLFRDFGMKAGDIVVMSKPLVARHEVLTANNQVNYAAMPYDLAGGPWVIEIPASNSDYAVIGEICDNWQAPITMVGVEGPDEGRGGKYLLLPPGYGGAVPAGYIPVRLEGYRGTMIFRPVVVGKGTMEGSLVLARQTRAYPLADAANPRSTRIVDGWDRAWRSLPVYDASWFDRLATFIDDEPVRGRDKVMLGMLSSIGIEKGKPFKPDPDTSKTLDAAAKAAYRIMQHGFTTPGQALSAWWPDGQWMNLNPRLAKLMGAGWSFEMADAVYTYQRAVAPFFWANYLPVKLGGEQLYLMGLRDGTGALFSGKESYRLRVPANVPVDKFWSAVVYSQRTKSFIPNPLGRVGLDSYDSPKPNPDGSVDIYFGEKAANGYEQNWLPSAGEDFFVIFRFYGPANSIYEKTWRLPDIQRVQA